MEEPIEETYFKWLYSKVASVEIPTPSLTYWTLFRDLHSSEFHWLISGDDNRAADGVELRKEFLRQSFLPYDDIWFGYECSVLEMLIAFSRIAEFETDEDSRYWFWVFLNNLKLSELNDATNRISEKVNDALDPFIWRRYRRNGVGGLFPISHARRDQRKLEIWYQFCEYLVDQNN